MQLAPAVHGMIAGTRLAPPILPIMTEPTSDLQYRVERPATDPLELEADAPHHRRRGRVRRGRPGGEHAARLPVGLGRVHRLVRRPRAGPAAAGSWCRPSARPG